MSATLDRRSFLKVAGGTAAAAVLAACAPTSPATQAPAEQSADQPAEPPAAEDVTLQWAMYQYEPWLLFLKEMFAEYKESNPNVSVELVEAPWGEFWPKLESMAAAGDPVNISICEPQYFLPWWERDLLLDLNPLADTVDESIFFPYVRCSCLYNEETQFMGCSSGGSVLPAWPGNGVAWIVYMNMDMVKAAGLDYPDENWTWDDWREYAIAMTIDANGNHPGQSDFDKNNVEQYGTCHVFGWADRKAIKSWIYHAGGRHWDDEQTKCMMTDPEALAAINDMYDLATKLGTSPAPGGFEGIAQPFLTGKIGMHMTGSWNVDPWATELTDFEWDIARLPIGPGGPDSRFGHTGWGNQLAIFKGSSNQDETQEIFKWALMTKEGTSYFGRAGIPLVRDAVDSAWLDFPDGKHLPAHRELQVTCMEEENANNTIEPAGPKNNDLYTVIQTAMDEIRLDRITPDEFAQQCCEGFEKVWAEDF
ncbi:MAG: extracellular solute-binding protein [Chloroflexi bacterium]|nr:extracellular solute-binding protein [Chloroflexota bacterium]